MISPLGDDGGARFKRGLLVHRLLQGLPGLGPKDREGAARAFLAGPAHGLDDDGIEDLVAEVLAVLDDPDFGPLFGPGSLAEVPITGIVEGAGGTRVLSAQVDRLVVTDDAVMVVDYKTNRPPAATESDVDPGYLRQMALYRDALRSVYPDRPVRAFLLWTTGPRLMALGDEILDAALLDGGGAAP